MNQPILKLIFFDQSAGKGEGCRLALASSGLKFEDYRISRERFKELNESEIFKYDQLPALEVTVNGVTNIICQSASILRYIGRLSIPDLLYPTDLFKAALVDSIMDQELDLFMGLVVSRYPHRFGFECIGNTYLEKINKGLNDNVFPKHLAFYERILSKSKTGWIAGTYYPSIADFQIVPRLKWLSEEVEGISHDILKPFPLIKNLIEKLLNEPNVLEYYKK
jgi:glutathione S-transferase